MARIAVNANVVSLIATFTKDELAKVNKFASRNLELRDENGNAIFVVQPATTGSVSKYGVAFADKTANGGFCCYTTVIPADKDAREFAHEVFGAVFEPLCRVESQVRTALVEIAEHELALDSAITGLNAD